MLCGRRRTRCRQSCRHKEISDQNACNDEDTHFVSGGPYMWIVSECGMISTLATMVGSEDGEDGEDGEREEKGRLYKQI